MSRLTLPIGGMSLVDAGLLDMDEPHGGDDWLPGPPPPTPTLAHVGFYHVHPRASRISAGGVCGRTAASCRGRCRRWRRAWTSRGRKGWRRTSARSAIALELERDCSCRSRRRGRCRSPACRALPASWQTRSTWSATDSVASTTSGEVWPLTHPAQHPGVEGRADHGVAVDASRRICSSLNCRSVGHQLPAVVVAGQHRPAERPRVPGRSWYPTGGSPSRIMPSRSNSFRRSTHLAASGRRRRCRRRHPLLP